VLFFHFSCLFLFNSQHSTSEYKQKPNLILLFTLYIYTECENFILLLAGWALNFICSHIVSSSVNSEQINFGVTGLKPISLMYGSCIFKLSF
jgi:hypothetical protein